MKEFGSNLFFIRFVKYFSKIIMRKTRIILWRLVYLVWYFKDLRIRITKKRKLIKRRMLEEYDSIDSSASKWLTPYFKKVILKLERTKLNIVIGYGNKIKLKEIYKRVKSLKLTIEMIIAQLYKSISSENLKKHLKNEEFSTMLEFLG